MTANIQNVQVRTLYTLAEGDASVLTYGLPDAIFGFHAQQASEKLLKALIAAHGLTYPLTHKLDKPITLVVAAGEVLPQLPFNLLSLNPYAVEFRYEDADPILDDDRLAIRQGIQTLQDFVFARVLALEANSPLTIGTP